MPRALLCLMIVAAFSLRPSAAETVDVALPVSASTITVLQAHGLTIDRDPPRFLTELTRLLHAGAENRSALLAALRRTLVERDQPRESALVVTLPFGPDVWTRVILKRPVPPPALVAAIATDRKASLLLHGLEGLDDQTRAFLGAHPALLATLYERGAAAFAAFAGSLRIRGDRVVPPGDEAAVPLWEAIVGAPASEPARFVALLFGQHEGRLAYLYDTIAQLEPHRARFALSVGASPAVRLARLQTLAAVAIGQFGDWKIEARPFSRPVHDLALLLARAQMAPTGTLGPPADRPFWSSVFEVGIGDDAAAPSGASTTGGGSSDGGATVASNTGRAADDLVDAAWLVRVASQGSMSQRADRIDQLAFAQRVFNTVTAAERPVVIDAVKAFPTYRMLMLTLERMGVRRPATYVLAARQAARLDLGNSGHSFWQVAQMQSALALVARMRDVATIEAATAEALVDTLFSTPLDDRGRYGGTLLRWLAKQLLPRLPAAETAEARVILALAGRPAGDEAPRVSWEGQAYRVDPAFAEHRRLQAVRRRLGGYTVDLALALDEVAERLRAHEVGVEDVAASAARLSGIRDRFGSELDRVADVLSPGVEAQRPVRETIERLLTDLTAAPRTREPRAVSRQAALVSDAIDVVLGEALLTLTYAADLGSPDGAALLARNVALRHDFGFGRHGDDRTRTAWAVPRQDFQPGVPWHVTGSALGLDVGLARLSLNRLNSERLSGAPKLSSLDRDGFAVGAVLLRAHRARGTDLAALRATIARGRERVAALVLGVSPESFDEIATELGIDGWRRRAMWQAIADDPHAAPELFSLAELLLLGGVPAGLDVHVWGANGLQTAGCLCTRFMSPRIWRLLAGRNQLALGAAAVPDLNLRVAVMLSELDLPAALARPVLAGAVDDFIAEVDPSDIYDWWTLARTAARLSRERIEDYVASAASIDGALVPEEAAASR